MIELQIVITKDFTITFFKGVRLEKKRRRFVQRSCMKVFTLLTFLIITGCNLTDGDDEAGNGNTGSVGTSFTRVDALSGIDSLFSIEDSITITVNFEAGKTYKIEYTPTEAFNMKYKMWSAQGELLESGYTGSFDAFKANENQTVTICFYLDYSPSSELEAPYTFVYHIKEFGPLDENLNGKWLLLSEEYSALGEVTVNYSSASDAYCLFMAGLSPVIEFRNDSIIEYYYFSYDDSVRIRNNPYPENPLSNMKYKISGDTLTFTLGDNENYAEIILTKLQVPISEILWAKKNYIAPSEYNGYWYCSKSHVWGKVNSTGKLFTFMDWEISETAEIQELIKIENGNVWLYSHQNGPEGTNVSSNYIEYFRFGVISGDIWSTTTASYYANDIVWREYNELGYEECGGLSTLEFTRYTGVFPPAHWQ